MCSGPQERHVGVVRATPLEADRVLAVSWVQACQRGVEAVLVRHIFASGKSLRTREPQVREVIKTASVPQEQTCVVWQSQAPSRNNNQAQQSDDDPHFFYRKRKMPQ